jgi:arylsulfatase A-like enzyme
LQSRAMRFLLFPLLALALLVPASAAEKPNIIVIYGDDIGYGDLSCYGATKVQTPNSDRLAAGGLRFTNGHSTSATCTPSRYGMFTGEYPWRKKGTNILPGDAPAIILPGRTTLPSMLQKAGYATGAVGKWHLGLGTGTVDWNKEITPGPREIGFDYSFLIPATGDRVPCVYTENQRVVGLDPEDPITVAYGAPIGDEPTGRSNPELLKYKTSHGHDQTIVNGISRIGFMSGGKSARWVDEDMADVITRKATDFIEQNKEKPFFLYFATQDIHVPRAPHSRFAGKSGCGIRGDVIMQFDWCVGQIVEELERAGLREKTLIILSSDNGPVVDDGYHDGAVENLNGHKPAGPLRGGKYSAFEAGTRVPFIVNWPGRVKPGTSDALVCQIDFISSLAALIGQPVTAEEGIDSFNVLPALLGESRTGRDHLVRQAAVLSLIQGSWKLIEPGKGPRILQNTGIESGQAPKPQLYNLADDLGETRNLAAENPEKVSEMTETLVKLRQAGRSRNP